MRDLRVLNGYRDRSREVQEYYGSVGNSNCGVFHVNSPISGQPLKVVAASGEGWDHVSVSLPNRCPNWPEMEYIKRLFFKDDETAMQLHVPPSEHVNNHPYCLHLWRPLDREIPRPDPIMVG